MLYAESGSYVTKKKFLNVFSDILINYHFFFVYAFMISFMTITLLIASKYWRKMRNNFFQKITAFVKWWKFSFIVGKRYQQLQYFKLGSLNTAHTVYINSVHNILDWEHNIWTAFKFENLKKNSSSTNCDKYRLSII